MNGKKIFEVIAGSISYGTNIEGSDEDRRGIYCASESEVVTGMGYVDEIEEKSPYDSRMYELKKFSTLLLKQNPNIIEILWSDPRHIVYQDEAIKPFLDAKHELLSKEVAKTYIEYASSQMQRIKGHNKMIQNPQSQQPPQVKDFTKINYNLTVDTKLNQKVPPSGYVLYQHSQKNLIAFSTEKVEKALGVVIKNASLFDSEGRARVRPRAELMQLQKMAVMPDLMLDVNMQEYKDAHTKWSEYWSWLKNRNPQRSQLEINHGYDTKHAMHTIRLLRIGQEILSTNRVNVFRADAQELKGIRAGQKSYEELLQMCNEEKEKVQQMLSDSTLKQTIDPQFVADLMMQSYHICWGRKHYPSSSVNSANAAQEEHHQTDAQNVSQNLQNNFSSDASSKPTSRFPA